MRTKLLVFSVLVGIFALVPILGAEQFKPPAAAPVPPQIAAARSIFIANGGGASLDDVIDATAFNGGPDRPYDQFYAAMKGWGRYQIASSPAAADLVLQISWDLSDTGLKLPVLGQLRLLVIDPKTDVTLWTLTEYVRGAVLLGNRDKNFNYAMDVIVNRLKALEAPRPAAAQ
jgi:hypothetical protein